MIGLRFDKDTNPKKMQLPHHCPPSTLCSGRMERSGRKGSHLGPAQVDRPTQLFYIWMFICVNIQIRKTQQGNMLVLLWLCVPTWVRCWRRQGEEKGAREQKQRQATHYGLCGLDTSDNLSLCKICKLRKLLCMPEIASTANWSLFLNIFVANGIDTWIIRWQVELWLCYHNTYHSWLSTAGGWQQYTMYKVQCTLYRLYNVISILFVWLFTWS